MKTGPWWDRLQPVERGAARPRGTDYSAAASSGERSPEGKRADLLHREIDRCGSVLPLQGQPAFVAASPDDRHLIRLHHRGRLTHLHRDTAEVLLLVVVEAALSSLLVDDQ